MNSRLFVAAVVVALLSACPEPMPPGPDGGTGVAPIITSIAPTSGPLAGNTTVTINGTNFVAGATVTFGGVPATATTFDTDRKLTAITPAGASVGAVNVTVTNPGGRANTLMNAFTYEMTVVRTLREAVLRNPADSSDSSGAAMITVPVIAHIDVPGSTNGAGAGNGVRVEVGFSTTVGATPTSNDFTWTAATYVGDVDGPATGDLARDSYSGNVSLAAPTMSAQVIYFLAARVSLDGGQSWTLIDRDGSANGALTTELARVTVLQASVEWCKLGGEVVENPPMLNLRVGATGPTIYGQVFKTGVTNSAGAGTGIKGAIGYGAPGTDPSTWTWTDATFNVDTGAGANDEFQAVLPNPGAGTYKFAFRFNHSDGPWSYCDADGLANAGFTEAQAGTLTVTQVGIDSCNLQFPNMLTSYEGRPSTNVYGRVFVQGLTEAMGAGAGVEGELGVGPNQDPTNAAWVWTASTFNIDDGMGGDEFQARLTGPAPGNYNYAYRFRVSGGAWTYCDRDGSMNGVQPAQLGILVAEAFDVSNCTIESMNAAQNVLPNTMTQPWNLTVGVPTLTDGAGQGTPLTVQFGYGAQFSTPSTWTTWTNATYSGDAVTADRYQAAITAPMAAARYDVAFRVQVGARPFVYCDRDGSYNGFQVPGALTVSNGLISTCRLVSVGASLMPSGWPLAMSAEATIPAVTVNPGKAPNLRMQFGIGPQGANASTSPLFGWQEATYSGELGMADEFRLTAFPAYTGNRAVSARASLDGLSWTYCDINGSDINGYEVNQQYDVQMNPHVDFDFCNTQAPTMSPMGGNAYGQIYEPGLTPDASTPFIAQIGVGEETEDPGFAWEWRSANFNVPFGNNNEYVGVVPDAGVGKRFAFRYTIDGGTFCYGDLDGSQNGFSGGSNVGTIVP